MTEITFAFPTVAFAKLREGVPLIVTTSEPTIPTKAAVPVELADVVASYVLFTPANPEMVKTLVLTVLETVATLTFVALVLLKTIFPV